MTRNNTIRTIASLLSAVVMLAMNACTVANLDLCEDEHPHKGQLIVEYDWSGVNGEHPDSMVVVALRPVFRDKVASNWAADVAEGEEQLYGRFIASVLGDVEFYYSPFMDLSARDSIFLPAGEWIITTYTSNSSTVESTKKYVMDIQDEGSQLFFKMEPYDNLPEKYAYWYDRNSYSNWVEVPLESSVCMASSTLVIDEYANTKKDYKVTLEPQSIAQKVNIAFDAEVQEEDIVVDSIVCAISGIPRAINLSTMELDIDVTHQAIFETELSNTAEGHIKAEATLYALGIVRSSASTFLQGPGILNVCVFVHFVDDKNIRRERRLDATVNLFRLLSANPSVKYNEEGNVVQACSELNLVVQSTMLISKSKLSNADDALDAWVDETIVDLEN